MERANAWLLENKLVGLRYDRLGFVVESLLQAACIFLVAPRLAWCFGKPPFRTSPQQFLSQLMLQCSIRAAMFQVSESEEASFH